MANYEGIMRTNYFRVTDVKKFEELTDQLIAECDINVDVNGDLCWIGCYSPLEYAKEDENGDYEGMDTFYKELSKLIADGDAAIFMEVGNEKLRYLVGFAAIVTNKGVEYLDLTQLALSEAKEVLGNKKWTTKIDY